MHLITLLPLAFAATALSQTTPTPTIPEGYRKVILNTIKDAKFAVQAQTPVKSGSGIILFTVAAANPKPEQQWWIKDGSTKVQLANTGFCLDAGTGEFLVSDHHNWDTKESGPNAEVLITTRTLQRLPPNHPRLRRHQGLAEVALSARGVFGFGPSFWHKYVSFLFFSIPRYL